MNSLRAPERPRACPARRPLFARRAMLVATAVGAFLVPWSGWLAATLPATAQARHWWLAWAGLDAAEAVAAHATAVLLRRGDPRAALTAMAGGTLLLTDAWFDVCTAPPGPGRLAAVADAALAEVPLAAAAFWLALTLLGEPRDYRDHNRAD